jgi:hypothetical protein
VLGRAKEQERVLEPAQVLERAQASESAQVPERAQALVSAQVPERAQALVSARVLERAQALESARAQALEPVQVPLVEAASAPRGSDSVRRRCQNSESRLPHCR